MRTCVHTVILLFLLLNVPAAMAALISAPTNGFYLGLLSFFPDNTNEPFLYDKHIAWAVYCEPNQVGLELDYSLDCRYSTKLRMFDADGKEVSKTALGIKYGSRFDQWTYLGKTSWHPTHACGSYTSLQGEGSGGILPLPKELFFMETPGIYTMEIQMQMIEYNKLANKQFEKDILHFPPVRLKVEMPLDAEPTPSEHGRIITTAIIIFGLGFIGYRWLLSRIQSIAERKAETQAKA